MTAVMEQWFDPNPVICDKREVALLEACAQGDLGQAMAVVGGGGGGVDWHCGNDQPFRRACRSGHLHVARWLVETLGGVDVHFGKDEAFRDACFFGHLEVAQWLVGQGGVDVNAKEGQAFYVACTRGHLRVAQWLASVPSLCSLPHWVSSTVMNVCRNGHLEVLQWLVAAGIVDLLHRRSDSAFMNACYGGCLDVAQWLFAQFGVSGAFRQRVLKGTCAFGRLQVVKWLVSLGGMNIHANDNYAFSVLQAGGQREACRWLLELDPRPDAWPVACVDYVRQWGPCRDAWMRAVTAAT